MILVLPLNYLTPFVALDFKFFIQYTFFVTGTETVPVTDFIKIGLPGDYFARRRDDSDGRKANY